MIINTGMRTDIPAFYSRWFLNRIREGYVMVRNPYYPDTVTRYSLDPDVVDLIEFCTKDPRPMLPHMDELSSFNQFWFVTINAYGTDVERNVPDTDTVIEAFRDLSKMVGKDRMSWRYDPVLVSPEYDIDFHIDSFEHIASKLSGYTDHCVFSFLDLYEKVMRNFPEALPPSMDERRLLAKSFGENGKRHDIIVHSCCEGKDLDIYGIDTGGCITKEMLEHSLGRKLDIPKKKGPREACECVLGNDIGAYNTCGHLCRYCYANSDEQKVRENMSSHDPDSPLLLGIITDKDTVVEAKQRSYISGQRTLI